MECRNHAGVTAADRCSACMEAFCGNCLITMKGLKYCGACKYTALSSMPVLIEAASEPCDLANDAIKYAYIGIVCFGFILGPMAIKKALDARRLIAANPNLTGGGKVRAALVIAPVILIIWLLRIVGTTHGT